MKEIRRKEKVLALKKANDLKAMKTRGEEPTEELIVGDSQIGGPSVVDF